MFRFETESQHSQISKIVYIFPRIPLYEEEEKLSTEGECLSNNQHRLFCGHVISQPVPLHVAVSRGFPNRDTSILLLSHLVMPLVKQDALETARLESNRELQYPNVHGRGRVFNILKRNRQLQIR